MTSITSLQPRTVFEFEARYGLPTDKMEGLPVRSVCSFSV